MLDVLLVTLIREMRNEQVAGRAIEARDVTRRFVRSVVRIFVVLSVEITPQTKPTKMCEKNTHIKLSLNAMCSNSLTECCCFVCSKSSAAPQPIQKCRRVFQALVHVAIEELCATADSLVAPVRLGVVRPTAPFALVASQSEALTVRKFAFITQICEIS